MISCSISAQMLKQLMAALRLDRPSTTEAVMAQLAYLAAAADVARRRFTLFEQGPIWFGCGGGVFVLALQLLHCW